MKSSAVYALLAIFSSSLLFTAVFLRMWPFNYSGNPFYERCWYPFTLKTILCLLLTSACTSLVTSALLIAHLLSDKEAFRFGAYPICTISTACGCAGIYLFKTTNLPIFWSPAVAITAVTFDLAVFLIMAFEALFCWWQGTSHRQQPSNEMDEKYGY